MSISQTWNIEKADHALDQWRVLEIKALELLKIVGELRFNKSIELVLFRRDIYDSRPSGLIQLHK